MEKSKRKKREGLVISTKSEKTAVVRVEKKVMHPMYKKYIRRFKKYMIHDEKNECVIGNRVSFIDTRPISKRKKWRLLEIFS